MGINLTSDEKGTYYLDQKKLIESAVKAVKVQKLSYPLEGPSLSKADNAKTEAKANEMAKLPYRALVGMLSYIMGHTKPDIAYAVRQSNIQPTCCSYRRNSVKTRLRCFLLNCTYTLQVLQQVSTND